MPAPTVFDGFFLTGYPEKSARLFTGIAGKILNSD
ncbi:MAG: hypothetical protein ACI9CB_001846 [Rhodothermales bacterium]|jgi:hypothetical protein